MYMVKNTIPHSKDIPSKLAQLKLDYELTDQKQIYSRHLIKQHTTKRR